MKETEQTLLDQIKEEVASRKHGCSYGNVPSSFRILMLDEIAERYATAKAKASCEATLIKASENANVSGTHPSRGKEPYVGKSIHANHSGWDIVVDKSSITNKDNIVIL